MVKHQCIVEFKFARALLDVIMSIKECMAK